MDSSPGTASSNDTSNHSPSDGTPPSSSDSSPPKNDSPPSSSSSPPPKDESPPSSPPPQSPPPSSDASPPPKNDSSPPASPPPSSSGDSNSSPPIDNNQSPPPSQSSPPQSPPPSSTPNTPSPPNAPKNNNGFPPSTVFSPPTPASHELPHVHMSPPPPSGSDRPSEKSSGNDDSDSSSVGIIAGLAVGGIFIIALIILCVWCARRKKKQRYYMGPGPKGGDQYYNNNNQWNRRQSMDHVMKVPQAEMGTQGGWAAATPHQATNSSSELGSGFSGQAVPLPPQSPNVGAPNMGGLGGFSQSQFTYEELAKATDGFSQPNLLGQGGFGYVHKGVLNDGRVVAIKSLKAGSGQGEREFQAEVEIISRVHHRHLVSLVGYCIANGQRMLVYEFVDNKTLEFHLHGKGQPVMDWETRLKIALGSAKGLAYLHEDCQHRIIHRDIKAANILLDQNYEALVADFGLAKLTSDNNTHVSTRVMGTFGYLAPEYASSGKLTEKSDVFSYGVMLLELITAKKPVDPSNMMEDSLVDWARPLLTRALEEEKYDGLVDARLEGNYDTNELHRMIACAASSIRHSAKRRPKMSQIVRALEGNSSLEDLNDSAKPSKTPSFAASNGAPTQGYDTGMYNADMMKFRKMIMPTQEFNSEHGTPSE